MSAKCPSRPGTAATRDPCRLGGRDSRPWLAGRPRVLAGAAARRGRIGAGETAAFSFSLGATQIRDPATPQALGYVRQMMLNMAAPDHFRLRRLLSRSFTRRAVSQLERRIRGHARAICDRVFTGLRGECDFAKDVAPDLPLAYPGRRAWRAAAGPLAAL